MVTECLKWPPLKERICFHALANNKLDLLHWLAEQAPEKIVSHLVYIEAGPQAAGHGNLELVKIIHEIYKTKHPQPFNAENTELSADQLREAKSVKEIYYKMLQSGASEGKLPVLEWFKETFPTLFTKFRQQDNYKSFVEAFIQAAMFGQLHVLEWLKETFPNHITEFIKERNYKAFNVAAEGGHASTVNWLISQVPDLKDKMIRSDINRVFSAVAANGHVTMLMWLKEQVPDLIPQLVTFDNYRAFNQAHQLRKHDVVQNLLQHPQVFGHAESHYEYRQAVAQFLSNQMRVLREKREAFEEQQPNAVFNITDVDTVWLCYFMASAIIKNNDRNQDDDLRFLLDIPAVKALAHQTSPTDGSNALLRFAISYENTEAAQILLAIPAVRELAERENFYRNERGRQMNLAQLAQDRESSMHALTTSEQKRLDKAIKLYQPMLQQSGTSHILDDLRSELARRYEENPTKITVGTKEIVLPLTWEAFNALKLDAATRAKALEAYYENDNHTAYRYLSKPNHWMHVQASYVYINPDNRDERWSTFEDYTPLITMLWLAAIDTKTPAVDGHTIEGRIDHFINELAHIGRAHNWDRSRIKVNEEGEPEVDEKGNVKTEEYDDKEADRPSCFSGVKRRLFQSVVGHPLLTILTPDLMAQEVLSFATAHFKKNFTFFHREAFQTAMRHIVDGDNVPYDVYHRLKELDITPEQIKVFTTQMSEKYGDQYKPYHADVVRRFTLPADNDTPSKRQTHFIKLMPATTPEIYIRTMEARDKPKPSLFQPSQPSDALLPPGSKDSAPKP